LHYIIIKYDHLLDNIYRRHLWEYINLQIKTEHHVESGADGSADRATGSTAWPTGGPATTSKRDRRPVQGQEEEPLCSGKGGEWEWYQC